MTPASIGPSIYSRPANVDSIGVMETLAFIANEFNIEVPESELLDDAFSNIDGMARIIARFTALGTPPKRQGYKSPTNHSR